MSLQTPKQDLVEYKQVLGKAIRLVHLNYPVPTDPEDTRKASAIGVLAEVLEGVDYELQVLHERELIFHGHCRYGEACEATLGGEQIRISHADFYRENEDTARPGYLITGEGWVSQVFGSTGEINNAALTGQIDRNKTGSTGGEG